MRRSPDGLRLTSLWSRERDKILEPLDIAMLLIRIALGVVMLAHGVKHARGRAKTTAWFGSIGFNMPEFQWLASTATELGVGVLLIAGLGTSLAAAGLIGITVVAFASVHRKAGFWITARPDEGYEYVMILAVAALGLAMIGPGSVSVDNAVGLAELLDGWIGLVLALGGVAMAALQLVVFYRPGGVQSAD
jgi:putative oxidoreductase